MGLSGWEICSEKVVKNKDCLKGKGESGYVDGKGDEGEARRKRRKETKRT